MIVKLKLKDANGKEYTMLFGTSYKNYLDQIKEYFGSFHVWNYDQEHSRAFPTTSIISIEASKSEWKHWGGLKWCPESDFQEELNREGCQQDEPDNPYPRQYSEMKFNKNYYVKNLVYGWYKGRYKGREVVQDRRKTPTI